MKFFRRGDRIRFSNRIAADMPDPRSYDEADRFRDFAHLFNTPTGQKVVAQILVQCGIWDRNRRGNDSFERGEIAGMRDIGLWLMETINMEPETLPAATEHEEPDG